MEDILTAMSGAVNALQDYERGLNPDGHYDDTNENTENQQPQRPPKVHIREAADDEVNLWNRLSEKTAEGAGKVSNLKHECEEILSKCREGDDDIDPEDVVNLQERILTEVEQINEICSAPEQLEKLTEINIKTSGIAASLQRIKISMGKYCGRQRESVIRTQKDDVTAQLEEQEASLEAQIESLRKEEENATERLSKFERRIKSLEEACNDWKNCDEIIQEYNASKDQLRASIEAAEERLRRQQQHSQDLLSIVRKLQKEKAYRNALKRAESSKKQKTNELPHRTPRKAYNRTKKKAQQKRSHELQEERRHLKQKLVAVKSQAREQEEKTKEAVEHERSEESRNIQTKVNAIRSQIKGYQEQSQKYRLTRFFYGQLQRKLVETAMNKGSLVGLILHCVHQAGGEATFDQLHDDVLNAAQENGLSTDVQAKLSDRKELTRAIYDMCNSSLLAKDATSGKVTALT